MRAYPTTHLKGEAVWFVQVEMFRRKGFGVVRQGGRCRMRVRQAGRRTAVAD